MEFNLADLFESVADAIPDRVALVCGDQQLTYAELEGRANRLANYLADHGVGEGDHLGVHLYNGFEYIEAVLAALKIRAVPVNINYRYVAGELASLFQDADIACLVHQREFSPAVEQAIKGLETLKLMVTVDDDSGLAAPDGAVDYATAQEQGSPARDFDARSGDDLYIIYTGGTTGAPKGVMWRQEDLFFAGMGGGDPNGEPATSPEQVAEQAAAGGPMAMFPVPPLMHGAAQLGTFIGFFYGAKVVLVPRFDPVVVWRMVERERVNTISLVGDAMARPMAEALESGLQVDTSSLLVISSAGAIFSNTVKELLGRQLPNIGLIDSFGASETGFQGRGTADSSPDKGLVFQMNDRTAVVDEQLQPIAAGSGVVGRVALKGRVPIGYYNDPEKTRDTFFEVDGVRWAMLGDMGTVNEDGTVRVFGRGSQCINSGGEKIFPEEVEAALKSHPDVFDAVVVGVPDERWGERVTAVIAPRDGSQPTLEDIDRHCETRVARYKLPRGLVIVSEVVRSPSGKPDYGWARDVAVSAAAASPVAIDRSPAPAG